MMTNDELIFALNDARHRQAALVDLIYSIERQAGGLLRLYVTLGLASVSAIAAAWSDTFTLPSGVVTGLLAAVVMLLVSSWFCFRAMRSALVALPGRGADFWIWANDPQVQFSDAATTYLENLEVKQERDRKLNERTAANLSCAKWLGILTPIVALLVSSTTSGPQ